MPLARLLAPQQMIGGMTLLEVLIASAIFTSIIMGTMGFIGQSQSAVNTQYLKAAFESQAQHIVDRMVNEVRKAINVQVAGDTLQFRIVEGLDASNEARGGDLITYKLITIPHPAYPNDTTKVKRYLQREASSDTTIKVATIGANIIEYGLFENKAGTGAITVGLVNVGIRLTFKKKIRDKSPNRPIYLTVDTEVCNTNK
jgi:Tfp pilus assembly protein PilV